MRKKKIIRWLLITLAVILGVLVILSITGTVLMRLDWWIIR